MKNTYNKANKIEILAKRLSTAQKGLISQKFLNGEDLDALANEFGYTKLTIARNLKQRLGEDEYNQLIKVNKNNQVKGTKSKKINLIKNEEKKYDSINNTHQNKDLKLENKDVFLIDSSDFLEIAPLEYDINDSLRKDLSSIPIDDMDFPKMVYMIINNKTELEPKLLNEYPEWHFLPEEDLKRKTIEIYSELKNAKRYCKKEQKVIKVPNTRVFKIASKIIKAKGISRIISDKQLIAL